MNNIVVPPSGGRGLTAFAGGVNPFSQTAADAGVSSARRLNFNGKTGVWSVGKEDVDDGAVLAFDLWNAKYVWTAWKSKKPVETHYFSIVNGEKPTPVDQLTNHWAEGKKNSDGWQLGIMVKTVDPNVGEEMDTTFKADTPWRPILKLLAEYGSKMKTHLDEAGGFKIPLIEIGTDKFETKDGDTAYAPTLRLADWISVAEMDAIKEAAESALAGDEAEDVQEAVTQEPVRAPASAPKPALRIGKRV